MRHAVVFILLLLVVVAADATACTTFCARGVFGRNYDFETGEALVMVNKRGLRKAAMTGVRPRATWSARYGSVTFNQFGREFPMDGMNEAGLVVALMWLDGTRYPDPDERGAIGVLEWIQYQLDTAATVDEVIGSAATIRILSGATPLHYLVADSTGAVATIEFLEGQQVVHRGEDLPVPVLTNDRYASSLAWYQDLRSRNRTPSSTSSLDRFARASMMLETATGDPVDDTLAILSAVAQPASTRWSVAYDTVHRALHYVSKSNRLRRTIDMKAIDFRCSLPALMLPLDAGSGDVTDSMTPYDYEANRALIDASYAHTSFLRGTSPATLDATARHPETAQCDPGARRRAVRR